VRDLNATRMNIAHRPHLPAKKEVPTQDTALSACAQSRPLNDLIKDDITPDERAFIESHRDGYPELETIMIPPPPDPSNGFMAHLIGYVAG